MAATITEEVRAVFTADTTGLVNGIDRAKKATNDLRKAYNAKTGNVKDTILNPSSLLGKGIDKLTSSMKLSAFTAGAVGAGFEIATSAISNWRAQAAAAKQETDALNESVRRLTNQNTFTTSAEGTGSLTGRLASLREQQIALRDQDTALNPSSFSDKAALHAHYFENYGIHGEDQLANDRRNVGMQQRLVGKQTANVTSQIPESLKSQLDLSAQQLSLSQQDVTVTQLQLEKQRELNDLRAAGVAQNKNASGETNESLVARRFDNEITAQNKLGDALEARYRVSKGILDLQTSSLSVEQQSAAAAQMRIAQIDKEFELRKDSINAEENRSLTLERESAQNDLTSAQRRGESKSGAQLNRGFFAQRRREARNKRLDKRIGADDGLINIERDINGDILTGTDRTTGQRRGPSTDYLSGLAFRQGGTALGGRLPSRAQRAFDPRHPYFSASVSGLTTGTLSSGGLSGRASPTVLVKPKPVGGINDQSAGHTLISAAKAQVAAVNISNAYLKQMQMDTSTLVAMWS